MKANYKLPNHYAKAWRQLHTRKDSCGSEGLLYGQWFNNNICPTQNNLVFNNDYSYIRTYSGNSCDANEYDTYQYTGTYTIDGNSIAFNQQTEMIIEEGTANPLTMTELVKLINQKIITLTETELTIEREFDMEPIYRNWYYTKE